MRGARILVVDDDSAIRTVVSEALRRDGYQVHAVASLAARADALERFRPDLLITDVVLPDGNGLDGLGAVFSDCPDLPVIVLSAQNTLTTAVRATEQGAFDYLPKPFDLDALCQAVRAGLARQPGGEADLPAVDADLPLIGRSPPMQEVYRLIARVVGNDLTVLVLGESGTGKELVARAIHDLGPRRARPFVAVNMAAIPRELIEAELFGHERGAFTGANARAIGRFEDANGGTLFLDEIGDMPMEAQTRLLRVLQSNAFSTVGGRTVQVDVRVIAATHQDLSRLIEDGLFREDLYYRLNVIPISLPPLRARGDDIVLLAQSFLERAAADGLPRRRLSGDAEGSLRAHGWPGNVRELDNMMRRLAALSREPVISAALIVTQLGSDSTAALIEGGAAATLGEAVERHLAAYFVGFGSDLPPPGLYDRVLADVERPLFRATLAAVRGNQLRAADLLGINRNTLRKRLTELGIEVSRHSSR
jgi:two-component system, NtrC family, nitrogen regulation response regulator GlnG